MAAVQFEKGLQATCCFPCNLRERFQNVEKVESSNADTCHIICLDECGHCLQSVCCCFSNPVDDYITCGRYLGRGLCCPFLMLFISASYCFCDSYLVGKGVFGSGGKYEWIPDILTCNCCLKKSTHAYTSNSDNYDDENYIPNHTDADALQLSHVALNRTEISGDEGGQLIEEAEPPPPQRSDEGEQGGNWANVAGKNGSNTSKSSSSSSSNNSKSTTTTATATTTTTTNNNNKSSGVPVKSAEVLDLDRACSKLWDLDLNRLAPGVDYVINVQTAKSSWETADVAKLPLFTQVNPAVFQRPTFKAFVALLDNYIADIGVEEVVTREELVEAAKFLDLVYESPCMQFVHKQLVASGKTRATTKAAFVKELNALWFELFSKRAHNDSSGFEHVFLGEVRDGEVTGLHSWVQIYLEEKAGRLDYKGHISKKKSCSKFAEGSCRFGDNCKYYHGDLSKEQIITMNFTWRGAEKKVSTSMIGTSPEFEMALYTLAFYHAPEGQVETCLGPYRVVIKTHQWEDRRTGKKFIATSYPEAKD